MLGADWRNQTNKPVTPWKQSSLQLRPGPQSQPQRVWQSRPQALSPCQVRNELVVTKVNTMKQRELISRERCIIFYSRLWQRSRQYSISLRIIHFNYFHLAPITICFESGWASSSYTLFKSIAAICAMLA